MMRSLFAFFLVFFSFQHAAAHEGRPIHIQLQALEDNRYDVRWRVPPVLREAEAPIIELQGGGCQLVRGTNGLIGRQIVACDSAPTSVSLAFPGFNPALSTLLEVERLDGEQFTVFVGPEVREIQLPDRQTFLSVAQQYLAAGFDHILEGFDHLLFVFCLLFVVGSFKRILWAVTGFTLGHSITLGLTALYGLSLPPSFVEPLIALSIAMLAAEKILADRLEAEHEKPLVFRFPALIATLFGLLHGFGFGGALAEIGLPYGYSLTALAFFNIGVELGQIAFILVVLVAAKLAQQAFRLQDERKPLVAKIFLYPAGLMAGFWTVERVMGILV